MTAQIRIGIVGAGFQGTQHAHFIGLEPRAVLSAVSDPFSSALAESRGVRHFQNHADLIDSKLIDGVIISNPNDLHVSTAIDFARAGIPVLLEKPVATTLQEGLRLERFLTHDRAAAPVAIAHQRRHHPVVIAARQAILDGTLGALVAVSGMWLTRKSDEYFDSEWRLGPSGGVVLINVVHEIDLLRHLVGEIESVQASYSNAVRAHEAEDTAGIVLRFETGAIGTFIASDASVSPWTWDHATRDDDVYPFHRDAVAYHIAGTRAALSLPNLLLHRNEPWSDRSWKTPLATRNLPVVHGNAFGRQLGHFLDVVEGRSEPAVTVHDAVKTMSVIEAIREAAETGTAMSVSPVPIGGEPPAASAGPSGVTRVSAT